MKTWTLMLVVIGLGIGSLLAHAGESFEQSWRGSSIEDYMASNGSPRNVIDLENGHHAYDFRWTKQVVKQDGNVTFIHQETRCKVMVITSSGGAILKARADGPECPN